MKISTKTSGAFVIFPAVVLVFWVDLFASEKNSRIIQIDLDRQNVMIEKSIPFGKPILLEIMTAKNPDKIDIYYFSGAKLKKVEAAKSEKRWSAIVGPFPPGEDLEFRIETSALLRGESLDSLFVGFEKAVEKAREAVFREMQTTEPGLLEVIRESLNESFPSDFDAYRTVEDRSLKELAISAFLKIDMNTLVKIVNNKSRIENTLVSLRRIFDSLDNAGLLGSDRLARLATEERKILEKIGKSRDELKAESEIIAAVEKYVAALEKGKADLDKKKQDLLEASTDSVHEMRSWLDEKADLETGVKVVLKTASEGMRKIESIVFAPAFSVSAEVCDLESYAGFDVAAVALLNGRGGVGTFFLINPYLVSGVEIGKDPKKLFEFVTPTVGIGIRSPGLEEIEGGIYFVGLGIRINRAFRLTGGWVFYKDPAAATREEKAPFRGHFSLGISLNFRDLGDLLKIFRGTSAYLDE